MVITRKPTIYHNGKPYRDVSRETSTGRIMNFAEAEAHSVGKTIATGTTRLAHEAGVLDAQTAIIRGKPKPVKTVARLLDEFAAKHAKPKPVKAPKGKKTKRIDARKVVLKQLEEIVKLIIFWRDGQECVEKDVDGARCGNGLMWGHVVTQHQSAYLKYDLSNVFVQCGNHNLLHDKGDTTYTNWYIQKWGPRAFDLLTRTANSHHNEKRDPVWLLREKLEILTALYEQHLLCPLATIEDVVEREYFGDTIAAAWESDGRLERQTA